MDTDIRVTLRAWVQTMPSGQQLLLDNGGKEEASHMTTNPTSAEGVDDMIKLSDMTEAGLLRNLQLRHKRGIIYTYIGSVLVAVNPYQNISLYSGDKVKLYQGRNLGELPPHVFALAESCYSNMTRHLKDQCCIISGESGAGKTESTKLILQYLVAVSSELAEQPIEKQVLESNPILEAFGNAKTIRNDNSSRFGKYLEIFFSEDGVLEGARVEQYLLEKSRVCHQALEERNYHIFYCMLAGVTAEEKKSLSLGDAQEYTFLTKGDCTECESRDDAKNYRSIRSAMDLFFSNSQCQDILKVLAAMLHLGNVRFEANTLNNLETSDVSKSEHFSIAASQLGVNKSVLATSLTHRSFMTNRESVIKPLSSEQASDCRDAFVKAIYNKLFLWIVRKINGITYKKLTKSPKSSFLSIGLLDIFGFENFDINSFEQLCINFANEKLQQFFVDHIFKLEQKEYLKEGIVWNNIKFNDNKKILNLLAVKPCNLLALIDEESHFPKGSDLTMLQKMNQHHSEDKTYVSSKSERDTEFGIHHFAGVVYYDTEGFLEKNRDAISADIIQMVDVSTNQFLHQIFESETSTNGMQRSLNKRIIMTPKNSLRVQADKPKQIPTLSGQFRQSLDSLMKTLSACHPFFIRCIKPNNDKQPWVFDKDLCMNQLRYCGLMDTVRIRKLGYPIRHSLKEFLQRYRVFLNTSICNPNTMTAAACCEAICRTVIQGEDKWKIGKTKIFLKGAYDAILERLREQDLNRKALVIQRFMKRHLYRKSSLKKHKAAVVLQKNWRAYRERRKFHQFQRGFERLVSRIRGRKLQSQYKRQRKAALTIQSHVRGYQVRKDYKKKREAAILLQASAMGLHAMGLHAMGLHARVHAENMKSDARREEDDLDHRNAESPLSVEEPEPITEQDSDETMDGLQTPPPIERQDSSESDEYEETWNVSEVIKAAMASASMLASSTSSLDKEDDEEDDEFDDDSDEFSFYRFSVLHFQGSASHSHITDRIKLPLLSHDDEGDALACPTVFWIILRYMEDLPEPRSQDTTPSVSRKIMEDIPHKRTRRLSSLVGLDQKLLRKNKKKYESARRASTIPEEPENFTENEDILIGEGPTLDRPLTSQEKLHIIIGYGLSRPGIRDEIYCQICKQLVNNRNGRSRIQGWTLLSICLGIFPPTDLFMKYLERFVRTGPSGYGAYCTERLRRTKENGERKELPCWHEIQAARLKKPIDVSVALMNDCKISLQLDSASTSAEVCQALAEKINLRDTYGFSLYINFYEKMWSLGSCGKHVLDAVSQCEHEMRRQGRDEKDTPWSLSIRKELFTPWHDCSIDPISTDLIYRQVIKGIKSDDYSFEKEDEYIHLAAQHYYIQFGTADNDDNVQKVVQDCIPTKLIEKNSLTKWIQFISSAHLQGPYIYGNHRVETVKAELVNSACQKWPLYFSKFYEVTMMSGPILPTSKFVVAVNWKGILYMEERHKKLIDLSYLEIKEVKMTSGNHFGSETMTLTTVGGQFVLKCGNASDMAALVEKFLEGLRQRSVYALVQQEASKPNDPRFLGCKRGDLLLVEKDEEESFPDENWIRATNQRTSNRGIVHKDMLQFLPTLSRPSEEMLELLSQKKLSQMQNTPQKNETVAPISIKEFAVKNFRPAGHIGKKGATKVEKLWSCSREPIKQPLMKILLHSSDLRNLACNAFTAILKYMGDYPIKQTCQPSELTDQIFGPATEHEDLQDEIYCQIMRQLTGNTSVLSLDRGWQLMWLCTGLFPPSPSLMKYAKRFLESRPKEQLAAFCLQRLQDMQSLEPRKCPPHQAELDAIRVNSTQIFHKVHLPNDKDEICEVTSTTTVKDLCHRIASQLRLSSADGFALYLKTVNKVTSLDEEQYFFDSLTQNSDSSKKGKKAKEVNQAKVVHLIFKRKLWFNVSPGKDLIADLTFHFPQELQKYLQGYHNCTIEEMKNLGGLLFRTQVDSDRSQFVMIPRMLKLLVPADQIKIMSPEEWKKHIISSYNKQSGTTVQEAKVEFLRIISRWPTFGCAFFEAKQTYEPSYPNVVLIIISKQGVSLTDPKTKEVLNMHPFSHISEFYSNGSFLHMTVRSLVGGNIFIFETPQAVAIEDLLHSYIKMYERQIQVHLPRKGMFS